MKEKGRELRNLGKLGELRVGSLMMGHWEAVWTPTPDAEATDGYLEWDDMPGVRLWVQIKSTSKASKNRSELSIRIDKEAQLSSWFATGPLLVVYSEAEDKAWWLDTAQKLLHHIPQNSHVFKVPTNQPVSRKSKSIVRRIALQRPRILQPFIVPHYAHNMEYVTPQVVSNYSVRDLRGLISDAYFEMKKIGAHERDIYSLSIARYIHHHIHEMNQTVFDNYLESVISRLLSEDMGGRSFTLGALTSLLIAESEVKIGGEYIDYLLKAVNTSVKSGTFFNPEFGLLIATSISQRDPRQKMYVEFIESLLNYVKIFPQNISVENVAYNLQKWLGNRQIPLTQLFPSEWIVKNIVRPLQQDDDVFFFRDEAEDSVYKIIKYGMKVATPRQIKLADQLTRLKAIDCVSLLSD